MKLLPQGSTALPAIAVISLLAFGSAAQTTNDLSEAEIHGRQLVQQILEQRPTENFTNTGVLQIRAAKNQPVEIPIYFQTITNAAGWQTFYQPGGESNFISLSVTFQSGKPNQYELVDRRALQPQILAGNNAMLAFLGSDFWICDLGLEFFHWPEQKILRGETMRTVFCKVLESTNPNPPTNGYSRVVSWIDNESLGIVQAKAYDAKGKLLKEFLPKDVKKVAGQWQVGSMEIDNVQTHSRTILKFDLKPN